MADENLLDIILNPEKGDPKELWNRLGFGGIPSDEQLRLEIEEQILTPKNDLLTRTLDQYQMYARRLDRHFILTET